MKVMPADEASNNNEGKEEGVTQLPKQLFELFRIAGLHDPTPLRAVTDRIKTAEFVVMTPSPVL